VNALVSFITGINSVANVAGRLLFSWVSLVQGEVSITIISAVVGVALLILFKYTSNQKAIGRVRDDINANLLAIKLFKDSLAVTLGSQVKLFLAALKLLVYSIVPMLIMFIPMSLLLAQMGLWYQARPFRVHEDAIVVKLALDRDFDNSVQFALDPLPGIETLVGPVRVYSKKEVYWKLRATKTGEYRLRFRVGDIPFEKEVAVGNWFVRTSPERPGTEFLGALMYPLEKPFAPDSAVRAIEVFYPDRDSKICGTNYWIIYFFVVSMVFAFLFKPILKVRI
jgi:uncharacterized membrane protein (DUF106 family)